MRRPSFDSNPSMIWITHPLHDAAHVMLEPDQSSWSSGRTIVLPARGPVRATVVDALGQPVAGATVTQWGAGLSDAQGDGLFDEHSWLITRTHETDGSGSVLLHGMPGAEELRAAYQERASVPWIGLANDDLRLELGGAFAASGGLVRGPAVSDSTKLFTVCHALVGSREVELARADTGLDRWGLLSVPLVEGAESYRFRMGGAGVLRQEHTIEPPESGARVTLDFRAEAGSWLWFVVLDADDATLFDAEITLELADGSAAYSRTSSARPDGYIAFSDCADGTYSARARCPGYVSVAIAPVMVPAPPGEEGTLGIQLERSGAIRGRVVADGVPVQNFALSMWLTHNAVASEPLVFRDRTDGSFELTEAPFGDVTLVATADGLGQSAPVNVAVRAGAVAEVRLQLANDASARGRVVDATTGAPVETAEIQRWISESSNPVSAFGDRISVAADGSFTVRGLARGATVLTATAPGFSIRTVQLVGVPDEEVDVGLVTLEARQALSVQLRLPPGQDPMRWTVRATGPEDLPVRRFSNDARVMYDATSAGLYMFNFTDDVTQREVVHRRMLESREPWLVELEMAGSASLIVDVSRVDGATLPAQALVAAKELARGRTWRTAKLDPSGRGTLAGLPPGVHQLEVRDGPAAWRLLATRRVELAPFEEQSVVMRIGEDSRRIRVIDTAGKPIAGVDVQLSLPGSPLEWTVGARTDARGECELQGLDADRVYVHLRHVVLGARLGIELLLPPPSSPAEAVEVLFESGARLTVHATGPRGPVSGVTGYLLDASGIFTIEGPFSDANGVLIFDGVAPGAYELVFDQPGYWTVRESIEVLRDGPPTRVELRRRCDLLLHATIGGVPLSGLSVNLSRVGDSRPLSDYLSVGWLEAEPSGLTTDSNGKLEILGLPEGDYTWRAVSAGGSVFEGAVTVEPDRDNRLFIVE